MEIRVHVMSTYGDVAKSLVTKFIAPSVLSVSTNALAAVLFLSSIGAFTRGIRKIEKFGFVGVVLCMLYGIMSA